MKLTKGKKDKKEERIMKLFRRLKKEKEKSSPVKETSQLPRSAQLPSGQGHHCNWPTTFYAIASTSGTSSTNTKEFSHNIVSQTQPSKPSSTLRA
jgi:hypothetical protein